MISASQLYDFVQCPHRLALDVFGNPVEKDDPNAFVELLWEQGVTHEENIVGLIGITANMKVVDASNRENETRAAIQRREPLIYGGRLPPFPAALFLALFCLYVSLAIFPINLSRFYHQGQ